MTKLPVGLADCGQGESPRKTSTPQEIFVLFLSNIARLHVRDQRGGPVSGQAA